MFCFNSIYFSQFENEKTENLLISKNKNFIQKRIVINKNKSIEEILDFFKIANFNEKSKIFFGEFELLENNSKKFTIQINLLNESNFIVEIGIEKLKI